MDDRRSSPLSKSLLPCLLLSRSSDDIESLLEASNDGIDGKRRGLCDELAKSSLSSAGSLKCS